MTSTRFTCPLGLQSIVVHSGPVPHLCWSFQRKSDGGLCLDKLAADHTYKNNSKGRYRPVVCIGQKIANGGHFRCNRDGDG